MPSATRIYWDACVFLSYINNEEGRARNIEALLASAAKGEIEIITSTISIAEVAFAAAEQAGHALDPAVEERIVKLWGPPVKLVEFHAAIGARAAALARTAIAKGWSLKPLDAVHLSSAEQMKVSALHTYDGGLIKYSSSVGFPVIEPPLAPVQENLFGSQS
jgi:predicted nucleic acid-binding protein